MMAKAFPVREDLPRCESAPEIERADVFAVVEVRPDCVLVLIPHSEVVATRSVKDVVRGLIASVIVVSKHHAKDSRPRRGRTVERILLSFFKPADLDEFRRPGVLDPDARYPSAVDERIFDEHTWVTTPDRNPASASVGLSKYLVLLPITAVACTCGNRKEEPKDNAKDRHPR